MKISLLFIIFLFITGNLIAQTPSTAKGKVFVDTNKNKIFDSGEKGVAGVSVSNQLEVVTTKPDGTYEIKITAPSVLFISIPSGYKVPVNEQNIPQFYYVYQPDTFTTKYAGLPSTGKLPQEINFPLIPIPVTEEFTTCYLGDIQSIDSVQVGYLRDDLLPVVAKKKFDFVITMGDVVWDDLSIYDYQNQVIAAIGSTVFNLPGNHDLNYDGKRPWANRNTWVKYFGPSYYSFNYGKVHFIQFDNIWQKGDGYVGKIGQKQLNWLQNDLKTVPKDRLIVLNMHIPLHSIQSTGEYNRVTDRDSLFAILNSYQNVAAFAGHTHTLEQYQLGKKFGWNGTKPVRELVCATVCGSWWGGKLDYRGIPNAIQSDGTPNGFHLIHFKGNTFTNEFVPSDNNSSSLRISSPAGLIKSSNSTDSICINFFNAGFAAKVTAKIDDGKEIELMRKATVDQYIKKQVELNKQDFSSWFAADISTHIFTAKLPVLKAGLHKITVTATDETGSKYTETGVYEIRE